jgi:hypothetical protein
VLPSLSRQLAYQLSKYNFVSITPTVEASVVYLDYQGLTRLYYMIRTWAMEECMAEGENPSFAKV